MNDSISIIVNTTPLDGRYFPLFDALNTRLCCFYGFGVARNQQLSHEVKGKTQICATIPRFTNYCIKPILKLFGIPQYYAFLLNIRLLEFLYSSRIARDNSKVIYTTPLFLRTIRKAKKAGKIVIVEAGNSEPNREHQRINEEYEKFGIKNKYIYGNPVFRDTCVESFKLADKIITISKVSKQTYIDAGYPEEKLVFIPLTGTDYALQPFEAYEGKDKAFVTTAFHNFIKGTHRLLQAWKKAQVHSVPLIIVGRVCEDIQEYIDKYGPFENVKFLGYWKGSLKDLYDKYDGVGVLMSLSEGAVRTTPELMSYGYPMIVSQDATCDIVEDGKNGYIISPTDEDGLSNRLKWFAEDWERVHEMRSRVLSSVSHRTVKDYSLECADFLLSLLK